MSQSGAIMDYNTRQQLDENSSDTTTSLDSIGSPETDSKLQQSLSPPPPPENNQQEVSSEETYNDCEQNIPLQLTTTQATKAIMTATVTDTLMNEDDLFVDEAINKTLDLKLDNRILVNTNATIDDSSSLDQHQHQPHHQQNQYQIFHQRNYIERTLANNHPLMLSPTDSDSDHSHHNKLNRKCHNQNQTTSNFPDVVPKNEHSHTQAKGDNKAILTNKVISLSTSHTLTRKPSIESESDLDISQYQAAVESNFQSVALVQNIKSDSRNTHSHKIKPEPHSQRNRRKHGYDDISSLDSISNHSFGDDEDIEHNLASLSPSSSAAEGLDRDRCDKNMRNNRIADNYEEDAVGCIIDNDIDDEDDDDDDDDADGPDGPMPDDDNDDFPIGYSVVQNNVDNGERSACATKSPDAGSEVLPQYSASEERRNSRNWQKVTLPDGRAFEIDMRVIEPYKRVLSHGGYLKAGGHNAIVMFCACHLPDRSRADYNYVMDNLFLYVVKTLDQLVTDDYVLIYLHGGSSRRNVPSFPWLKRCYQLLDRRLRKSLKNMYLVHPTFWVKSVVWMARPFVSVKFWRKLVYVKSLEELGKHVAVERAAIPDKVKQYDAKHC